MSVDPSDYETPQQGRASTYSSPFEDSTLYQSQRNDIPAGMSPTSFQGDFDTQKEFWPSISRIPRRTTSLENSLPNGSEKESQVTMNHTMLQNQPTSFFPCEDASCSSIRQERRRYGSPSRMDLFARNSLREMILSALLSESLSPVERVSLLEDCKDAAETSQLGIPFREILSEPMELLEVSPLMYEIMSCQPDWDGTNSPELGTGLEMVLYLIENWTQGVLKHGTLGDRMNVVRTACLRRLDEFEGNRLFQRLRPIVAQSQTEEGQRVFDYDISIAPLGGENQLDFTALISLPHFASHPAPPSYTWTCDGSDGLPSPGRKPPLSSAATHAPVEFLAARRAWRLKVDRNMLALELLDGPGGTIPLHSFEQSALPVDARVKVIMPEHRDNEQIQKFASSSAKSNDAPIELILPRLQLSPRAGIRTGPSEAKLSPCFYTAQSGYEAIRGLDDTRLLHDGRGALLLELTVRLGSDASGFAFVNVRNASLQQSASMPEAGPSRSANDAVSITDEDDLYVSSEVDLDARMTDVNLGPSPEESEWEEISQVDETEARAGGWVKASWSGRDEEL